MSVVLSINGQPTVVSNETDSIFDCAERIGVRVPTSCQKNGKCKECIVEVTQGNDLLSTRTEQEKHLKGSFRLSCQTRVIPTGDGEIRCHTMRRGQMRIERHAAGLPLRGKIALEPTVTRQGADRIRLDGVEIARSTAPIHGIAMDLGTTTVVLRLLNLETGEQIADASFENPQRFGGSDVMSRIHYDTTVGGFLLQRTLAGYLAHAIDEFPVDPQTIYELVVVG